MAKSEDKFHTPEEITDYIRRNYSESGNFRRFAIGWIGPSEPDWRTAGGAYRVIVTDSLHVNHTFKITPREIDDDFQKLKEERRAARPADTEAKRESLRKTAAAISARKKAKSRDRSNDREQER